VSRALASVPVALALALVTFGRVFAQEAEPSPSASPTSVAVNMHLVNAATANTVVGMALQQLAPQSTSAMSQSSNPLAQDFQQLAQDLQSGNLSAAQQDYTKKLLAATPELASQ